MRAADGAVDGGEDVTVASTVPDLQRIAIKIFAADATAPVLEPAVPVFHRWIQERRAPGILVDVADYGHLPQSPGVVLVSHEANIALDGTEGPLGLLYTRKTPLGGALPDRVRSVLRSALEACAMLEAEPEFKGTLRFRTDEILLLSNDRLAAPNSEEAFASMRPALESVFGGKAAFTRDASDPRRRLTIRIAPASDRAGLLARLA